VHRGRAIPLQFMNSEVRERFWSRIERGDPEECWPWRTRSSRNGYSLWEWLGMSWMVHRVAYTLVKGPIPDGLTVDHLCRNKRCCNPSHLDAVTGSENTKRAMEAKYGSRPEPCGYTHQPGQICRACRAAAVARTQKKYAAKYREMKRLAKQRARLREREGRKALREEQARQREVSEQKFQELGRVTIRHWGHR